MLIVDPPAAWGSAAEAVRGLKLLNFHSDHALMFFPRIVATDRLRARTETFGNGGAVAGMLSRTGEAVSAAIAAQDPEPLCGGTRLAREVASADRWSLAAHGVTSPRSAQCGSRTSAAANARGGASASSTGRIFAASLRAVRVNRSSAAPLVRAPSRIRGLGTRRDASAALPGELRTPAPSRRCRRTRRST